MRPIRLSVASLHLLLISRYSGCRSCVVVLLSSHCRRHRLFIIHLGGHIWHREGCVPVAWVEEKEGDFIRGDLILVHAQKVPIRIHILAIWVIVLLEAEERLDCARKVWAVLSFIICPRNCKEGVRRLSYSMQSAHAEGRASRARSGHVCSSAQMSSL